MSIHRIMATLLIVPAIVALAACAPAATPAPPTPTTRPTAFAPTAILQFTLVPTRTPTDTSKENTPVSTTPSSKPSQPESVQVTQAKEDLSKRLSIVPSQIEVVSFESVTWSDGSLGCPRPGMAYIQVLTQGYRIQLRAAGQVYEYHAGRTGAPFLCENPKPPASTGS